MNTMISQYAEEHPNIGVIISPRNIRENALSSRHLENYNQCIRGNIYFDSSCYLPRTSLERILNYSFCNDIDLSSMNENNIERIVHCILEYQVSELELNHIIIPNRFLGVIDDDFERINDIILNVAEEFQVDEKLLTIAIGNEVLRNQDSINRITNFICTSSVDGIYLLFEKGDNDDFFLTNDELLILLDSLLSISLSKKKVIIGYSNQQCLALMASGVNHLATGNYRNVKSFNISDFEQQASSIRRRRQYYFDGNSFSEFTAEQLSYLYSQDNLSDLFGPETQYTRELLESDNPANTFPSERYLFLHYFELMNQYIQDISLHQGNDRILYLINFFEERFTSNERIINTGFQNNRSFYDIARYTLESLRNFRENNLHRIEQLRNT